MAYCIAFSLLQVFMHFENTPFAQDGHTVATKLLIAVGVNHLARN